MQGRANVVPRWSWRTVENVLRGVNRASGIFFQQHGRRGFQGVGDPFHEVKRWNVAAGLDFRYAHPMQPEPVRKLFLGQF